MRHDTEVLSSLTRASIAPCLVWSRRAAAQSHSKLHPRHSAAPPRDGNQPGTRHRDRVARINRPEVANAFKFRSAPCLPLMKASS